MSRSHTLRRTAWATAILPWMAFCLLLAAPLRAAAQTAPAPASAAPQPPSAHPKIPTPITVRGGTFVFRTTVNEVVLNVTVVDHKQRLVTTLTEPDFSVYEDGVQQKISSFRHEDVPVSLGILIDNSGSMYDKRDAVNQAALDLVRASNPQDETFIVNFADDAYLDQDLTSNVYLLQKGLSHIDAKGGTALYDAIVAAADHLAQKAKWRKQVLLIITDGEDNSSSSTLQQAVRKVQSLQGPIIYSIGLLFGGGESKTARHALQTLSNDTGGLAYFPKSLAQVDRIAEQVAEDIRNQYTIGYHPTRPESETGYRSVRVTAQAKGMGKLTARTRPGYFSNGSTDASATGLVNSTQTGTGQ